MQKKTLRDFLKWILQGITSGYKYVKVAYIPEKKIDRVEKIEGKIAAEWPVFATRSQRAYRKRKGFANYRAARYNNIIIVMRTEGQNSDSPNDFQAISNRFELKISPHLTLIAHIAGHGRWTWRLDRETYRGKVALLIEAIRKHDYNTYKKERERLLSLLRLKFYGIGLQIREINKKIRRELPKNVNLPIISSPRLGERQPRSDKVATFAANQQPIGR